MGGSTCGSGSSGTATHCSRLGAQRAEECGRHSSARNTTDQTRALSIPPLSQSTFELREAFRTISSAAAAGSCSNGGTSVHMRPQK